MRVEAQFNAMDAAIAGISNMAFPQIGSDGLRIGDQRQVALGDTAVIDWRGVVRVIEDDGGNLGAQTVPAVKDPNDSVMILGQP
jgi:hypothetical protein